MTRITGILVCALVVSSGCRAPSRGDRSDAEVEHAEDAGDDASGDADVAPFAEECTDAFGDPVALSTDLSGSSVILEGVLDHFANPTRPASPECEEGLHSLVLWANGPGSWDGFVRLIRGSGEHFWCGCESRQDEECTRYPGGARVRVEGTLTYITTEDSDAGCVQPPCYLLEPSDRCFINGCDENQQCPGSTCTQRAHQCRALEGAECLELVGCESEDGPSLLCAGADWSFTCQPEGDGTEGSVCESSESCTCADCFCSDHICTYVPGA